ncbi:hypothetical protein K1719_005742 [Acacia pycnantha]|nr:hypothetical protein K1719_005742 [Acacia pycnantha]
MDGVFSFSEAERLDFLQSVLNTYGCAYICLWFYCPSSNRLLFLDGLCNAVPNCLGVFDQYRGLQFDVTPDNYGVPGLAFRNHQYTCLELQQPDLLRLACTHIQRRFFQEARIKTAVFIGCGNGEIELGFSVISQGADDIHQTDVMRNLFTEEFSRQSHVAQLKNPSSRFLRSILSTASSPESTYLRSGNIPPAATGLLPDLLQQRQENEHEAIVRAILHVISSPSSSSSNSSTFHELNLPNIIHRPEAGTSAFTRYRPNSEMSSKFPSLRKNQQQSLLKRSFELLRGLHYMRNMRQRCQEISHPTRAHLLHVISERRRREKLNKNFQALRSLLPPGTKKDKGSILTAAKETLNSLMAEIEKMTRGDHQQAKAQMKANKLLLREQETTTSSTSTTERLSVRVSDVGGSSLSEERFMDLQVTVRGRGSYNSQVQILIRLLEFLKGVQGVSLVSVDANTHIAQEGAAINEATLTLKIEGGEWDEAAFREAVRRVVADLAE